MVLVSTVASSITAIINAIGQIEKSINNYYKRKDLIDDMKLRVEILKHKFQGIQNQLPIAASVVATNPILAESLRVKQMVVQTYYKRVLSWREKIESAQLVDRVRRMNEILNDSEKLADNLIDFFNDKVSPLLTTDQSTDTYVPINYVPKNPPRLTFDFSSRTTNEGKLKHAILDQRQGPIIALIASGQGGTGKTCALRGLVDDDEVKQRFAGGMLFIPLGNDASKSDVIRGLAEIAYQTGGTQISREIKALEKVQDACNLASRWFSQHTCLFLVDDLWNVNGIDKNIINALGGIAHNRSRMAYTSRDEYFLDLSHDYINFEAKEPNGDIARTMLLNHSSFSKEDLDSFEEKNISAFEYILSTCQGLPLALGIMGGSIRTWRSKYLEHSKQNVWSDFRNDMQKCMFVSEYAGQVQQKEDMALRRIVDLSLNVLDNRKTEMNFPLLFRALSVIRKQQSIPITALHKIWGSKTIEETKEILEQFSNVSLVQVLKEDNESIYLQLHDLVLDIAQHEASKRCEIQRFHDNLINNYSRGGENTHEVSSESATVATDSKLVATEQEGRQRRIKRRKKVQGFSNNLISSSLRKGKRVPIDNSHDSSAVVIASKSNGGQHEERKRHIKWWNITVDGYIHDNICKLLHRAGKIDELVWLLSQPEWTVYRSLNGGVSQVEEDLNVGITALGQSESSAKLREHLEIIGKAVRLSVSYVYKNASEVWFQLYGRLQLHATINKWTERFIRSIERVAPRPWVKAPMGVLQQASLHSRAILASKGEGLCIRIEKGVIWHVWWYREEIGITSCDVNAEDVNTIKLDMSYFEENGCFQDNDEEYDYCPFWTAFSADGTNVVVVHESLRVAIFKTETGILERCFRLENRSYTSKEDDFRCGLPSSQEGSQANQEENRVIEISKDGKYIATSNDEHEVQIWSIANGKKVGPPLRGHTEDVSCMVIDNDGALLVTGDDGGTIRVWNARSGEAVGSPLCIHSSVGCLTLSADRSQVVSGASGGSVQIWDIRNETLLEKPSLSHGNAVNCVSISEDGRKIVSGSSDGEVIAWDVQDGVMKGQPMRGHVYGPNCVEISRDGSIAASVSIDFSLRVWNTKRNDGTGQSAIEDKKRFRAVTISADGRRCVFPTGKHTANIVDTKSGRVVGSPIRIGIGYMIHMGISADDKRAVCGFNDGTLIVFDTMSGEKIRETRRGHDSKILFVAISADGNLIASASSDNTVRLWDTESGACVGKPLVGHSAKVLCVAFSADGSRVISGSADETLCVWNTRKGEAIGGPFLGHEDWINCVGLNADGTKAVSRSRDGTVRVWDVQSSQQIGGPFQHDSPVYCLGFDTNISKIATKCQHGSMKLWNVKSGLHVSGLSSQQWNSEVCSLSWNGLFSFVKRNRIINVDENGNEIVLATFHYNFGVCNGPGSDIYFSNYSDPLILLR